MIKILLQELKKLLKEPFTVALLSVTSVLLAALAFQAYGIFFAQSGGALEVKGGSSEFEMRVVEGEWEWYPDVITVEQGVNVKIHIDNEDDFAHGFAIPELGVDEYLPGETTTMVEFDASKQGEYEFLCSVLCGAGHATQKGKLIIQ